MCVCVYALCAHIHIDLWNLLYTQTDLGRLRDNCTAVAGLLLPLFVGGGTVEYYITSGLHREVATAVRQSCSPSSSVINRCSVVVALLAVSAVHHHGGSAHRYILSSTADAKETNRGRLWNCCENATYHANFGTLQCSKNTAVVVIFPLDRQHDACGTIVYQERACLSQSMLIGHRLHVKAHLTLYCRLVKPKRAPAQKNRNKCPTQHVSPPEENRMNNK